MSEPAGGRYLAEILYSADIRDERWAAEVRAAVGRIGDLVPVAAWMRWRRCDVSGLEPTEVADLVTSMMSRGRTNGVVLSPVLAGALRRERGLRSPLPGTVIDIQFVTFDEASVQLGHEAADAPVGLRLDVSDETLSGTAWRRVRLPRALTDEIREGLDGALVDWILAAYKRAEASGALHEISTRALLVAVERLLAELQRLRDDDHVLRRLLAERDDEVQRLKDKLQAAELALSAEHRRSEPDRRDIGALVRWLGAVVATAVASGAGSYAGVIATDAPASPPGQVVVELADHEELGELVDAISQVELLCSGGVRPRE